MESRIIERTLYPPIVTFLKSIGFDSIGEARVSEGFSDVVFTLGNHKFVLEVKIEKFSRTLSTKAIAQAWRYARKYDTHNIIVLIYPESLKNKPIPSSSWLEEVTLNSKISSHIFTEYWEESLEGKPSEIFRQLKSRIETDNRRIDLQSVVNQIKTIVSDLNEITNYIKKEELITEVVQKLDLFTSIGDVKNEKMVERQITLLSSYLLFNQLMFYHVYQKKSKNRKLNELFEVSKVKDLQKYFDEITTVDFKSIYKTNMLGHIPENKLVIQILNEVIQAIKLLRADLITHDLAGRFFHDLIPTEVRKILAAFYTHPNSADILAGLTIKSWNDTVMDPACGSGTLLVAAYNRKFELYKKTHGFEKQKSIHKQFLENDITGSDIMPFASHLTTINLAMQDIDEDTNTVRIASMDSLELSDSLRNKSFRNGKGFQIAGYERSMQMTLTNEIAWSKSGGSVSMEGTGTSFYLKPCDIVIMNPPFSDREKMPEEMRVKLNKNLALTKVVGGHVNLWGYFVGLANLLLRDGGNFGAVIPINIARGRATQQLRDFLLTKYTCEFIIKPNVDLAFSEGAAFKDILYIAQKRKPKVNDYTGIVSINVSIRSLKEEDISYLIRELNRCVSNRVEMHDALFEVRFVKTLDLLKHSNNLMPLIGMGNQKNQEAIVKFLAHVASKAKDKIVKISESAIKEGFHVSPAGLSELVFITNPLHESRIERAFLILEKDRSNSLDVRIKKSDTVLRIPKLNLQPALRTLTGVKKFDVESVDYIVYQKPDDFNTILQFSKWTGNLDWFQHARNVKEKLSFVVVGRRFNPKSVNTHNFAFYSKSKIVVPDTFKIIDFSNSEEAIIQTLILNSSITISSIVLYREQTTGDFTDIRETELVSFDIFNFKKLQQVQIDRLLGLFQKLKDKEFPPIKHQYITNNEERRLLDTEILSVLGFTHSEISNLLDSLYKAISEELERKN